MFKVVGLALVLIGGITWLRVQWAVSRNRNVSKKLVEDLKSGKMDYDTLAPSLGMTIRQKQISHTTSFPSLQQALNGWDGKRLQDRFNVQYIHIGMQDKAVVIAEAVTKDINTASGKEMNITYPCWISVEVNTADQQVVFRSAMPENKDHQYLLEDLSDEIFIKCTT